MRLLNTDTHKLEYFEGDPPSYAILSHRWGKEEVLFRDLENDTARAKSSYSKIERTCALAAQMGIGYAWIDTCCINKSDSAELSESINSMYLWYEESTVCYVYLGDLSSTWRSTLDLTVEDEKRESTEWLLGQGALLGGSGNSFQRCEWFSRGWTLQELLAPQAVVFVNEVWEEVGTKLTLWEFITERTGIPGVILHGEDVQSASVAQRMSWAADRKTSRIEDEAYCLMGLFGVNMPLLYGERHNAFLRLQQEIIKVSNDYSILAWNLDSDDLLYMKPGVDGSLLAPSPFQFKYSWSVQGSEEPPEAITTTSQGIHLSLRLDEGVVSRSRARGAWLPCTYMDKESPDGRRPVVIFLSDVSGVYKRVWDRYNHLYTANSRMPDVFTDICAYQSGRVRFTQPVLSRLAKSGQIRGMEVLLEKGIGQVVRKGMCKKALDEELMQDQMESMGVLFEKGFEGQARTDVSVEALDYVLRRYDPPIDVVAVIVQKGLGPNERKSAVMTALRNTAKKGWWPSTKGALLALDRDTCCQVCLELLDEEVLNKWDKCRVEEVLRRLDCC